MERNCGACRYFRCTRQRDDGRLGTCRLEKVMGVFREEMHACPSFSIQGDPNPPVADGRRRTSRRSPSRGTELAFRVSSGALATVLGTLQPQVLKSVVLAVISECEGLRQAELGRRWAGGELILAPADASQRPKSLALDAFFHKLVMMRDNLRVLEQKVNSATLTDAEKVDVQVRIARSHNAIVAFGRGWLWGSEVPSSEASGYLDALSLMRQLACEARYESLTAPVPRLGERWSGGEVRFTRGGEVAVTEPVEGFFFRLVTLRDRLRGLGAYLEAHNHLPPQDVEVMSSYLRRSFGTLTTFNVLFHDRADYFSSR